MDARLALTHAMVQVACEQWHVDALHLKGAALDESVAWPGRSGTDVDLLVRPAHLARFVEGLRHLGWVQRERFHTGSSFEHAAGFYHPGWAPLDVHRHFPGLGRSADEGFDVLWPERTERTIAGIPCAVPSLEAQALVVLVHAARSGGGSRAALDVQAAYWSADQARQKAIEALAERLDAQLPLDIALQRDLDSHRGRSDFALWRVAAEGGTRLDEWRARAAAAPTRIGAARVLARSLLVNRDSLSIRLGRPISRVEVVREFIARLIRAIMQEWRRVRLR